MKLISNQSVTVAEMILNENENNNEFVISEKIINDVIIEENIVVEPKIYDIPLEKSLQLQIYDECNKYNLSETLIFSIIKVESNFKTNSISKTQDYGLLQLNKTNHKWLAEQTRIDNFNPLNPKENIIAGIWYLNYLRDYWQSKNHSDEQIFNLMLNSYHFGITKVKNNTSLYINETKYINAIYNYKIKLEREN